MAAAAAAEGVPGAVSFRGPGNVEAWLALRAEEEPLYPEVPIVDPHHHLLDAPPQGGGGAGSASSPARRPLWSLCMFGARRSRAATDGYMPEELLRDFGRTSVVATVFAQCNQFYDKSLGSGLAAVGETRRCQAVADAFAGGPCKLHAGIFSYADLSQGEKVEEVLRAHMQYPNFRGVRNGIAGFAGGSAEDPQQELRPLGQSSSRARSGAPSSAHPYDEDGFRAGFKVLARLGLTFDAWCYHPQLPELTRLARAFPEATVVCDHVGGPLGWGPYRGEEGRARMWQEWSRGMGELASCPNVRVKLSGLTMPLAGFGWERQEFPPSSTELATGMAPFYLEVLRLFGARRCMFASNFPVDKVSCSYTTLFNAFHRVCDAGRLSTAERRAALAGTAAEAYGLDIPRAAGSRL